MAMPRTVRQKALRQGNADPRLAPPLPLKHGRAAFEETAKSIGIDLMPWQKNAARYLTAIDAKGKHLYREVAIVVARQNGKTTLAKPLIIQRLRVGRKIIHIAQNRNLPRIMFNEIADAIATNDEALLPRRRGKIIWPRYGAGQEEITLTNGGSYRIAAANSGSPRGYPTDDVIIDELREMEDWDFIAAAKPTLTASPDKQTVYLSNAGTDNSVVLNSLKKRAGSDPILAYLEWSAGEERRPDEVDGWMEANPGIGHLPGIMDTLEDEYRTNLLADTMELFETEHLCRWVRTLAPPLVKPDVWAAARGELEAPVRPVMGISMDPDGTRASAVIAWRQSDTSIGMRLVADVTGNPIDTDRFGPDLVKLARTLGAFIVVHDPYDEQLSRHFRKARPVNGREFAGACGAFVRAIEGGRLHHRESEAIGDDLGWTQKRPVGPGAWMAIKRNDEHPITAALAAIRAVGAVSGPVQSGIARIY